MVRFSDGAAGAVLEGAAGAVLEGVTPDPFADLDPIVELEDEIRTLASQIHAATHRLLLLIADFDRRRGWEMGGHRCCADWLSFTTGIDRGAARERVRAARALVGLPQISEAMSRGELSFSQVRALTRVATPETESELLPLAMETSASRLERVIRGWRRGSDRDEALREEELHRSRCLSVFPDEDGMYVVRGVLPPELGLLLARAIDAASDALYREEGRTPETLDPEGHREAAARRRADALGLVAERPLTAGFGSGAGGEGSGGDGEGNARDGEGPARDGERSALNGEGPARLSGGRAERYQVVLHVAAETLDGAGADGAAGRDEGAGLDGADGATTAPPRSHFHDGTRVSAETCRRLCCDASVVLVEVAGGGGQPTWPHRGQILNVGRKTRVISPALRRALEMRDQGCRFPGCGCGFTDAHHILPRWNDGETSLDNTLLLCRHHHRLVHEGGWSIRLLDHGIPVFVDPRGGERFDGGWVPGRGDKGMAPPGRKRRWWGD